MPLEFVGNAISLSGTTGSQLKTTIISHYYRFWLSVTARNRFSKEVHIVDMNAGTGLLHNPETNQVMLGSAGHALSLVYGPEEYQKKLRVVLVEDDVNCRPRLFSVISEYWPQTGRFTQEGNHLVSQDERITVFNSADDFVSQTSSGQELGNSLLYFDPLRAADLDTIDRIAFRRIVTPYKLGTEFLVFFFTSDWVRGRKDFTPLPRVVEESRWTKDERESAGAADRAFSGRQWLDVMISGLDEGEKLNALVSSYKAGLRKWFRYVQPLPFVPKDSQRYDVFGCSNYEVGASVMRRLYGQYTQALGVGGSNTQAYQRFMAHHRHQLEKQKLPGSRKPSEWKVLWQVLVNHIDGLCDMKCRQLKKLAGGGAQTDLQRVLEWLEEQGYLRRISPPLWPWTQEQFPLYTVDWDVAEQRLGIIRPRAPVPLRPGDVVEKKRTWRDADGEAYEQTKLF